MTNKMCKKIKFYIDIVKLVIYKLICCRHSSVGRATDL